MPAAWKLTGVEDWIPRTVPLRLLPARGRGEERKKKDTRSCLLFLGAPAGHKEEDVPDQTWQCSKETSGINPETLRQPFPPPQVLPDQTPTTSFPHVNLVTYRLPSLIPPCCRSIPVLSHRCPRKGPLSHRQRSRCRVIGRRRSFGDPTMLSDATSRKRILNIETGRLTGASVNWFSDPVWYSHFFFYLLLAACGAVCWSTLAPTGLENTRWERW